MSNITVSSTSNFDDTANLSLGNGETITINSGAILTINADMRWGQNAAVPAGISISNASGGTILFDGTTVWEIAFTSGSGTVPTVNSLGSNGVTGGTSGATGELVRVWASGSLVPSNVGDTMPTAGWIKLRSKTGTFTNSETITLPGGATIVVNSSTGGKRSWIHAVTVEANTLTLPRRGSFTTTGDWYELGSTDGTDDQTFQFPVADCCPAIQVETSAGSGTYEWWLNAGDRWGTATQYVATDVRGKYFGQVNSTGVITIAKRASNSCGYKPASGCKVRIPNIIFSCTTSADYTANTINSSFASRYKFNWGGGGSGNVSIDKVSWNWYASFSTNLNLSIQNSALLHHLNVDSQLGSPTFKNIGIGLNSTTNNNQIVTNNLYFGATFEDVRSVRYAASNSIISAASINSTYSATFTRCQWEVFGNTTSTTRAGTTSYCLYLGGCYDVVVTDNIMIGAGALWVAGGRRITATNTKYSDRHIGNTDSTSGVYAFYCQSGADTVTINGLSAFGDITNLHPYSGIVSLDNTFNIVVKNIGTSSASYATGSSSTNWIRYIANLAANSFNTTLKKFYLTGANAIFSGTTTHSGVTIENVYITSSINYAINTPNTIIKSGRWAPNVGSGINGQYGFHWASLFGDNTTGYIEIAANEPTTLTSTQVDTSGLSSIAGFTASGNVYMPNLNDTIIWTSPIFFLGHTGFANVNPVKSGSNSGNITVYFQYDKGSGWNGTWLTLTAANLSGVGTIDPAVGVKVKVKAVTTTAGANNLSYIYWTTTTTATAQVTEYPEPGATLIVQNLIPYSRVKVTRVDNGSVLVSDTCGNNTSLTLSNIPYSGSVYVEARKASAATFYKPWVSQTSISSSSPVTITALQEVD